MPLKAECEPCPIGRVRERVELYEASAHTYRGLLNLKPRGKA
jgi:hypothetical protein